jgi:hypothetical protein
MVFPVASFTGNLLSGGGFLKFSFTASSMIDGGSKVQRVGTTPEFAWQAADEILCELATNSGKVIRQSSFEQQKELIAMGDDEVTHDGHDSIDHISTTSTITLTTTKSTLFANVQI